MIYISLNYESFDDRKALICFTNVYGIRGYIDRKICRQFRLLIWTSFIDLFVQPVGGDEMGVSLF